MADNQQPIIIKKVKGHGHGHHGGAWKVAYADFVTAMMAFFLLLWLLNATTEEQKLGISNYFSPVSVSNSNSGSGGLFGGTDFQSEGSLSSEGTAIVRLPPAADTAVEVDSDGDSPPQSLSEEELAELVAKQEEEQFEQAAAELRQAIRSVPELAELQDSLVVEQTPEGLRIQLLDQERVSMFGLGSTEPEEETRRLLALVAEAVKNLPNRLSISGHTDGTPFRGESGYSNWELSADRANAARRLLTESGIDPSRVSQVQGRADTELLVPEDPTSPRNRRISIVLLRDNPAVSAAPEPVELEEPVLPEGSILQR